MRAHTAGAYCTDNNNYHHRGRDLLALEYCTNTRNKIARNIAKNAMKTTKYVQKKKAVGNRRKHPSKSSASTSA